ncbi:MAG: hypothetical protein QM677_10480 [Microbacterium sp.]
MNEITSSPNNAPTPESPETTQTSTPSRSKSRRRALIGTGAAGAILIVGTLGAAIGVAIADEDDDRLTVASSTTDDSAAVPADATALTEAIDAALAAVENATGATAIEVERDGWEVDVVLADGTESDVHVALDGTSTIVDGDTDKEADTVLDTAKLTGIIDAALAAAGEGTVAAISTDDDLDHLYDVSVDHGDGRDTDVELTEDLTVASLDIDD